MVILAGSELFTGNCLMVMALLERRITPVQLLRNLAFADGEQAPGNLGRGEHGQISFSLSCGFMRTQY